ncbi:hypothetical protein LBMAG42_50390 [Deltaproteobacteria bacterium]|nr:hypothetical protein LBMAG42_50390 [Deltaproteobacteria bacterium]
MTLLLIALLSVAHAQEGTDLRARELYATGVTFYEEGRYEDAVAAFEEAYRLSNRPALLFNIANAQERCGRWSDALDVLSRYRAHAPPEEQETLDRRISNLERRIAEGKEAPPVPVVVAAPQPVPPASTAAPATLLRPLPLAIAGAGVLSLGVGAVLGASALAAHEEADAACVFNAGGSAVCKAQAADPLAREAGNAMGADVLFIVGAVGVGAGTALALWGPGGPLSVGPGVFVLHGEF